MSIKQRRKNIAQWREMNRAKYSILRKPLETLLLIFSWPAMANLLVPNSTYYQLAGNTDSLQGFAALVSLFSFILCLIWLLYRAIFISYVTTFFLACSLLILSTHFDQKAKKWIGHNVEDITAVSELIYSRFEFSVGTELVKNGVISIQIYDQVINDRESFVIGKSFINSRTSKSINPQKKYAGLSWPETQEIDAFYSWHHSREAGLGTSDTIEIPPEFQKTFLKMLHWSWQASQYRQYEKRSIYTASIFSFWAFLIFGRVRTFGFIGAYIFAIYYGFPTENIDIFIGFHIKTLLFIFLCKYILNLYAENSQILVGQSRLNIVKSFVLTLLIVSIPIGLIVGSAYYWEKEQIKMRDRVYDGYEVKSNTLENGLYVEPFLIPYNKYNRHIERDMSNTITFRLVAQQEELFKSIDENVSKAKESSNEAASQTVAFQNNYNASLPKIFKENLADINSAFRLPRCSKWYHWIKKFGDCIERSFKKPLHSAYNAQRPDIIRTMEAEFDHQIASSNQQVTSSLDSNAQELKNGLRKRLDLLDITSRNELWNSLAISQIYQLFLKLIFLFYLIRFVFYVLTRTHWRWISQSDAAKSMSVTSRTKDCPATQVKLNRDKETFSLPEINGLAFYLSQNIDFRDLVLKEKTPQFFSNLMPRLKSGNWHMNHFIYSGDETMKTPYLELKETQSIISIRLSNSSKIYFPWDSFVGMTANVSLRKTYTSSLLSLLFHRGSFTYATYKGHGFIYRTMRKFFRKNSPENDNESWLFLIAEGTPDLYPNASGRPTQLLAFDIKTRFSILAGSSARDIYRSDIQVLRNQQDLAIFDKKNRKGNKGALSLVKNLLWPF